MALTPAEALVEAEQAYHDLMTGKAAVEFQDADGTKVRYTIARKGDLKIYIDDLKRIIAGAAAEPVGPMECFW